MKLRLSLAAFLFPFLPVVVAVSPAHAEWTWLYPKPQGHNLYDVEFLTDNVAIAVGEAATIMVTNDGGTTWSVSALTNGLTGTLRSVAAIDANTAVVVGDGGVVLRSIDAGATWSPQPSGTTSNLTRVDFVGPAGLMVGGGNVWLSNNGGQSWYPVLTGYDVQDVDMVLPSLAYLVSGPGVLRSGDGGLTWSSTGLTGPFTTNMNIAFSDPINGVVWSPLGGYGSGTFYFTADGGTNWDERFGPDLGSHNGISPGEIVMVDPQTLFAAGTGGGCDPSYNCFSYGPLLRTTDGATSWNYRAATRPLLGLDRNSYGVVLAVGEGGSIWQWSPPGAWQQFGGTQYDEYSYQGAMSFIDASTGIVSGVSFTYGGPKDALMLRTLDAGSSWSGSGLFATVVNDFTHAQGSNPAAYGVGRVQIAGIYYMALLKSTDNGATWPVVWSSTPYTQLNAVNFGSATHGVAVGVNGSVAVIDNDTMTMGTISGGGNLNGVAFADASIAVAIGANGLFRTDDGGTTWTGVPAPAGPRTGIGFASPTVGVAVGAGGGILRSTDSGQTWQAVPSPTTNNLFKVSFASPMYGMISGANGTLLETGDGGETWTELPPAPTTGYLLDLACFSFRHAYVLSWDLRVLEYRDNAVPTLFSSFHVRPREFAAELQWSVQNEANLQGFRVVRNGNALVTLESDARTYRDDSAKPGTDYEYVLFAVDRDGNETQSIAVRVTIPVAAAALLPNQPNPFNPTTSLRFVVPERSSVRLTVHDVAGHVVATLVDDVRDPGMHTITWHADGLASGVYFARLRIGKTDVSRKMVLLK